MSFVMLFQGRILEIEELFGDYLWNTISIRDTAPAKKRIFIMEFFWASWL